MVCQKNEENLTIPSQAQKSYIPKIDISPLLKHDFTSPQCQKVIKQIDDACRNVGFMSIVNHGIDKEFIRKMIEKVKQFFYLPMETKLKAAAKKWNPNSTNVYRGYFPSTVHGKEGLDIQDPLMKQIPQKYKDLYFYEMNNFPQGLSQDWEKVIEEYYGKLHNLAILLTKSLWYGFGKQQSWANFEKGLQRPYNLTTLRFNYYPKHQKDSAPAQISKQDGAKLACQTHVDSVIFTILYQDSQGGLQVKNSKDGKWYTVPFDQNAFVVNTGKTTQILTNGLYEATQHRVLMNYHERISIPFFFEPAADAVLDPNYLVQGKPSYKKETQEQFLKESLKKFKQYNRQDEQDK